MRLKEGVSLAGICPEMVVAMLLLESTYRGLVVITSVRDGAHMDGSLHHVGLALDVRKVPGMSLSVIRSLLGAEFDVIEESDHFHVEYQP